MVDTMNEHSSNTQAFDVLIPNGNEKSLLDRALLLGHKKIVLLSDDFNYPKKFTAIKNNEKIDTNNIDIKFGFFITNVNDINRAKNFDYLFARAERKYFESKVDYIIDAEMSDRKDSFHYKSTSLNQVHAELSRSNEQSIVFSFKNLLEDKRLYGRMHQNAVIAKKYSINKVCFSMAMNPEDIRSRNILDALLSVLNTK